MVDNMKYIQATPDNVTIGCFVVRRDADLKSTSFKQAMKCEVLGISKNLEGIYIKNHAEGATWDIDKFWLVVKDTNTYELW